MASRYWVGGGATANWNATGNTNWSATSGGANNASVPTAADDVFFDANSGATNCNIASNVGCHSLDMTGSSVSITSSGTRTFNVGGAANTGLGAAVCKLRGTKISLGSVVTLSFDNRSGGVTVTVLDGTGWPSTMDTDTTHTNTVTFATDFTCGGTFNHRRATVVISSGKIFTAQVISDGGTNQARTLSYASATIIVTGMSSTTAAGSWTLTGDSDSLIKILGSLTINLSMTFPGTNAGKGVRFEVAGGYTLGNNGIFGRLSLIQQNEDEEFMFPIISGGVPSCTTLEIVGLSASKRCLVRALSAALTCGVTATNVEFTNVDFYKILFSGTLTSVIKSAVGDCGGNTSLSPTTPANKYWVGGTGNWSSTSHWSLSSGGSSGAAVPLPQDAAIFDANSFSANGQTSSIDSGVARVGSIDSSSCTTYTHNIVFNINRFNGDASLCNKTTATGSWGAFKYSTTLTFTQNGADCSGLGIYGSAISTTTLTQAGDDLNVLSINAGTGMSFDMNGHNVQTESITWSNGVFTVSNNVTLTISSGGITISGGTFAGNSTADLYFNGNSITAMTISVVGGAQSWRYIYVTGTGAIAFNNTSTAAPITAECLFIPNANQLVPPRSATGRLRLQKIVHPSIITIGLDDGTTRKIERTIFGDQILQRVTFSSLDYLATSPDDTNTYGSPNASLVGLASSVNCSTSPSPRVRGCPV